MKESVFFLAEPINEFLLNTLLLTPLDHLIGRIINNHFSSGNYRTHIVILTILLCGILTVLPKVFLKKAHVKSNVHLTFFS